MPPFHSHAVRAGGREKRHGELQGERVHLRAVAGGWQVRKCHFRGLKHLRAAKKFSADAGAQRGARRGAPRRGAARPNIATSRQMPALVIGKGRENHCVQLPREEVHPRAMTGENTISVGKSPCLR